MQDCEFVIFISVLACTLAKDKTQEELNLLSVFLLSFEDTLATLSVLDANNTP